MMNTPRFELPNIMVSQAHKEITHNEALIRIDALLHMTVIATSTIPPSLNASDAGKSWLVGAGAVGQWSGKDDAVATWSGTSWDFFQPVEGMAVWHLGSGVELKYVGGDWHVPATIQLPQGGGVIDAEARSAIAQILTQLRQSGIIDQ